MKSHIMNYEATLKQTEVILYGNGNFLKEIKEEKVAKEKRTWMNSPKAVMKITALAFYRGYEIHSRILNRN